jgi:hypothetical protein
MMLRALIVEQLEGDGTLRSLRMQPVGDGQIVVAFAGEYDEARHGPFHFLDEQDEQRFREGFAKCRARHLGYPNFRREGRNVHVETSWLGIPTERNWLSYYALSLPEFAIPLRISIADPHRADREYRRHVMRDDERRRYVIYLECTSSHGRFDFDLECDFRIDQASFATSSYQDLRTEQYGSRDDTWKHWLDESEREKVQQFFVGNIQVGDAYSAGQSVVPVNREEKTKTLVDRYLERLKNHRTVALLLVAAAGVIGLAQFTDAVSKLWAILPGISRAAVALPSIPGDTGWVLLGDLDSSGIRYIRQPLYETYKSVYPEPSLVPRKGEQLRLLAERNLVIAGYRTSGLTQQFRPPWQLQFLSDADYTGIKIPKGAIVEVRDVSLGSFPGEPIVVWVRIGQPPH